MIFHSRLEKVARLSFTCFKKKISPKKSLALLIERRSRIKFSLNSCKGLSVFEGNSVLRNKNLPNTSLLESVIIVMRLEKPPKCQKTIVQSTKTLPFRTKNSWR